MERKKSNEKKSNGKKRKVMERKVMERRDFICAQVPSPFGTVCARGME